MAKESRLVEIARDDANKLRDYIIDLEERGHYGTQLWRDVSEEYRLAVREYMELGGNIYLLDSMRLSPMERRPKLPAKATK